MRWEQWSACYQPCSNWTRQRTRVRLAQLQPFVLGEEIQSCLFLNCSSSTSETSSLQPSTTPTSPVHNTLSLATPTSAVLSISVNDQQLTSITTTTQTADTPMPACAQAHVSTHDQMMLSENFHNQAQDWEKMCAINSSQALSVIQDAKRANHSFDADSAAESTFLLEILASRLVVNTEGEAKEIMSRIADTVQTLTQESYAESWRESDQWMPMLDAVESIVQIAGSVLTQPFMDATSSNVAINIHQLSSVNTTEFGLELPYQDIRIILSADTVVRATELQGDRVPLAIVSYSPPTDFIGDPQLDSSQFPPLSSISGMKQISSWSKIGHSIISVKLGAPGQALKLPITLMLPVKINESFSTNWTSTDAVCVFWNSTTRKWAADGCTRVNLNSSTDRMICLCDHMTSFAVLLRFTDYEPQGTEATALTLIGYIGCGVSVLCLLAGFIIFLYLDNLKTERKKIHMNLMVALALAQTTYVIGIDMTSDKVTCMCIAILLHFLFTATFTWMLCEGIHLYFKVVSVFDSENESKRIIYYLVGWGAPAVIVGVSVGVRHADYGNSRYCWLSTTNGVIWAFAAPVCAVIAVNFIIMIITIKIVVTSVASMPNQQKRRIDLVKTGVRSVMILTPILGINWLFGLLAVGEQLVVFEFLFVIVNSTQGLLLFLFHCVGSSEVRLAYRRKRELSSRSKSQEQSLSKTTSENFFKRLSKQHSKIKANWPPVFLRQYDKKRGHLVAPEHNVIVQLVEGAIGPNLGGLKHMVPPDSADGKENGAFIGEEPDVSAGLVMYRREISALSSLSSTTKSSKSSDASTTRTSLGSTSGESCESSSSKPATKLPLARRAAISSQLRSRPTSSTPSVIPGRVFDDN